MISLQEKEIDFNTLEKEVFSFVCKLGVDIIEQMLESTDKALSKGRDKKVYRHKGLRKNTIKTVMGEVEYKRAIYEHIDEVGAKKYVHLLDEFLDMKTIGKLSGTLIEKVLENSTVTPYRKAAENICSITRQTISHGAVWGIVKNFGEKLQKDEEERSKRYKLGKLNGEREAKVLFMEADGLWLSMQRKDRPKKGKKEIKLGIHHEGWERRSGKKEAYIVKNKGVIAGFTDPENFKLLRDSSIAEDYNTDEIEYRILNGDGATWIRNGHDAVGDYFQLDRFHIARAIIRNIKDKKEAKNLWKLFKACQFKSFMDRLNELKYECGGLYEEVKKIQELEKYIYSNKDGIIPYKKRITLPKPPEGVYHRGLGVMESNVFNVLGNRMKGKKMSWSISGANNLAKILAVKASGKLYEKIGSLLSSTLPDKAVEIYEETLENAKENSINIKKKIALYPVKESRIPFTEAKVTEGRKAIRQMFRQKSFTELGYK